MNSNLKNKYKKCKTLVRLFDNEMILDNNLIWQLEIVLKEIFNSELKQDEISKLITLYEQFGKGLRENSKFFNNYKMHMPEQQTHTEIQSLQKIIDSHFDHNKVSIKMSKEDKRRILWYGRKFLKETDYERGIKWVRFAAQHGETDASFLLGYCYDNGIGVVKDSKIAEAYYRQGANSSREYDSSCNDLLGYYQESWLIKAKSHGERVYLGEKLY